MLIKCVRINWEVLDEMKIFQENVTYKKQLKKKILQSIKLNVYFNSQKNTNYPGLMAIYAKHSRMDIPILS